MKFSQIILISKYSLCDLLIEVFIKSFLWFQIQKGNTSYIHFLICFDNERGKQPAWQPVLFPEIGTSF